MENKGTIAKTGKTMTYSEAFRHFDETERYMYSRVYAPSLWNNMNAFQLMDHLEGLATRYCLEDKKCFTDMKKQLYAFAIERTALANGVNGKRFYMRDNPAMLAEHDETHLFEVKVDTEKLRKKYDSFLDVLSEKMSQVDEYADTYSPDWPGETHERLKKHEKSQRLIIVLLVAVVIVFLVSVVTRTALSLGLYTSTIAWA